MLVAPGRPRPGPLWASSVRGGRVALGPRNGHALVETRITALPPVDANERELQQLLDQLPERIARGVRAAARPRSDQLYDIVLDLGRRPTARFDNGEVELAGGEVTADELAAVAQGRRFSTDNRAGVDGALHRISRIVDRTGALTGVTIRVGRSITGRAEIIRDLVESGRSVLLLGEPGVGKTTLLRDCARMLSTETGRRVMVVDTSNEIAGDGAIPNAGIGRARRMQVADRNRQHDVMIEAVQNHTPQTIIIDEIGTAEEALAARTIAQRGVQLVATAHGRTIENLLNNPSLNDLLGGVHTVTLGDVNADRRGTQKTVQEREFPPTFDVLVELVSRDCVRIWDPVDQVVDSLLLKKAVRPEVRGELPAAPDATTSTVARKPRTNTRRVEARSTVEAPRMIEPKSPVRVRAIGFSQGTMTSAARRLSGAIALVGNGEDAEVVLLAPNANKEARKEAGWLRRQGRDVVEVRSGPDLERVLGDLRRTVGAGARSLGGRSL
jgi:stage III sporulation protein AA